MGRSGLDRTDDFHTSTQIADLWEYVFIVKA